MPYPVSDATIKAELKDSLGIDAYRDTGWDAIIARSNIAAQNAIRGALIGRGFNDDQVNAWDRAEEFNVDIALFWALYKKGVSSEDDTLATRFAALDRRAELATVDVTVGGVVQQPSSGNSPAVSFGEMKSDADRFSLPAKGDWPWR